MNSSSIAVSAAPQPSLLVASEVNLTSLVMDEKRQVILVTASSARAGTTRSVASLTLQLAAAVAGRVLILDTSSSPNNLSNSEGAGRIPGLVDLLAHGVDEVDPADLVVRLNAPKGNVDLLPLGRGGLTGALEIAELNKLFAKLKGLYRFIIVDSDSVYEGDSTLMLAAIADATVLVVTAEAQRWEVAQATVNRLTQAGAQLIGAIFNRRRYYMPRWIYERL